jgi:hypothetical protein
MLVPIGLRYGFRMSYKWYRLLLIINTHPCSRVVDVGRSFLQYPPCELDSILCSNVHHLVLLFQDDDDEEDEDEVDNGFDDDEDDVEDDGDEVITLCCIVFEATAGRRG